MQPYPLFAADPGPVLVADLPSETAHWLPCSTATPRLPYVAQDELGNVTHLTDQNGQVLERYEYEGYGKFRIFDPNGNALSNSAYGWTRLFQGREYIPMLDAYDFRARTLWPELGRFGQEDPAGTVDSTNRYQALGGRWTGVTDPLGLYEEDVHHYLTMYLAEKAGFPRQVASRIGYETGHLDFDSRDAMEGNLGRNLALGAFGNRENEQLYHFAKPDRQRQMSEYATKMISDDFLGDEPERWHAVGEHLHQFEDAYSHQKGKTAIDPAKGYRWFDGHMWDFHEPDWTWERPILAHEMAYETFKELKRLCASYRPAGSRPCQAVDWTTIAPTVMNFVSFVPPISVELQKGFIPVQFVADYSEKVAVLDKTYTLRDYETRPRRLAIAQTRRLISVLGRPIRR